MTEKDDSFARHKRVEENDDGMRLRTARVEMGMLRPRNELRRGKYFDKGDQRILDVKPASVRAQELGGVGGYGKRGVSSTSKFSCSAGKMQGETKGVYAHITDFLGKCC